MKYIITESQYNFLIKEDRIAYLRNQIGGIYDPKEEVTKDISRKEIKSTINNKVLGVVEKNKKGKIRIRLANKIFNEILDADPSTKKSYSLWLLNLIINKLKLYATDENGDENILAEISRLIEEDLPQVNYILTIFDSVKNKKIFKEKAKNIGDLPSDPTNIQQYTSISQLQSAIDPFIEKEDVSDLRNVMNKYVKLGDAEIPYDGEKWLVYVPFTQKAAGLEDEENKCLLSQKHGGLTSWCTAWPDGSYFGTYVKNQKRPKGEDSKLYIVMDKGIVDGTAEVKKGDAANLVQIHPESNQFKDADDREVDRTYLFKQSNDLKNFFINEFKPLIGIYEGPLKNNPYIKMLISMGEVGSYLDFLPADIKTLDFTGMDIPNIPNVSKFKNLEQIVASNTGIDSIHPSIAKLKNIQSLSLGGNKLKEIPVGIGSLPKLSLINLTNNELTTLPDEFFNIQDKLLVLSLVGNNFSEEEKERIRQGMPELMIRF